ncbi:MAG: hypothetical protein HC929_18335 [Leptolyngbyaceae cyanobacterium SM2_5_2]|nr:hypothetical protein [Leptolyngbyaceae cyanobacterium SM2_5_2]
MVRSRSWPSPNPATAVLWGQVWGLAAMLAAILFSFMIYGFYQPTILKSLGFGGLASQWAIFQGILGFAVEPAFGGCSDRFWPVLAVVYPRLP